MTNKDRSFLAALLMILIVLIAMLLSSCSDKATRQLRRSEKLLNKAIANGAKVSADTIIKEVTLTIPEVRTDTIFQSRQGDTVVIQKDRLRIKYVNLPADSVYIEGECKADTIIKRIPVAIYKKIESGRTVWDMVILSIFVAALSVVVGMIIQGRRARS